MKTTGIQTRYRVLEARYHGPGNVCGSWISIHDHRRGEQVRFNFACEGGDTSEQATEWLAKRGIMIDALGLQGRGTAGQTEVLLLTRNFETSIKGGQVSTPRQDRIATLRTQYECHQAWARQYQRKNGWTIIPAGARPPEGASMTNEEKSELELLEWRESPPEHYSAYVRVESSQLINWMGALLGAICFGREWRDNFGGTRVAIRVAGTNGRQYAGTYFKSAGNYARLKAMKP